MNVGNHTDEIFIYSGICEQSRKSISSNPAICVDFLSFSKPRMISDDF